MGHSKIDILEQNISKLLGVLERSRDEIRRLEKEKKELERLLADASSDKVHNASSLSAGELKEHTEKNQAMRKQLDMFIEELDQCIDMVEKL